LYFRCLAPTPERTIKLANRAAVVAGQVRCSGKVRQQWNVGLSKVTWFTRQYHVTEYLSRLSFESLGGFEANAANVGGDN
jgi:hypothetical protein